MNHLPKIQFTSWTPANRGAPDYSIEVWIHPGLYTTICSTLLVGFSKLFTFFVVEPQNHNIVTAHYWTCIGDTIMSAVVQWIAAHLEGSAGPKKFQIVYFHNKPHPG